MNRSTQVSGGGLVVVPRRGLCLAFANTLAWRGSEPLESLHDFAELVRWCAAKGVPGDASSERAIRWSERHPEEAAAIFDEAIAIREAIYRIFFAMAADRTPDARDVAAVNLALGRAPARRVLARADKGFGWRVEREGFSAAGLLAAVLWSAGDLMVGPDAARLRYCSNDKCRWLFLDDSKNGSRRWCSMQACGNRAKARRHYLKAKSA